MDAVAADVDVLEFGRCELDGRTGGIHRSRTRHRSLEMNLNLNLNPQLHPIVVAVHLHCSVAWKASDRQFPFKYSVVYVCVEAN